MEGPEGIGRQVWDGMMRLGVYGVRLTEESSGDCWYLLL